MPLSCCRTDWIDIGKCPTALAELPKNGKISWSDFARSCPRGLAASGSGRSPLRGYGVFVITVSDGGVGAMYEAPSEDPTEGHLRSVELTRTPRSAVPWTSSTCRRRRSR